MGIFGKLFEKKECAICGGEIGLLGNRKLEDGNMCKKCAAKLSPWFEERRHSTVEQIKQQLAYRLQNQDALKGFQPSRRIGENDKFIAEEQNGVPYRFVVSTTNDYMEENADLILFSDISSCVVDIDESRSEITHQNDKGETVSYQPPRYRYSYNFYIKLTIENNPYFDDIRFKLNSFSVNVEPDMMGRMPGQTLSQLFFSLTEFDPTQDADYQKYYKMCCEIEELVDASRRAPAVQFAEPYQEQSSARFCSSCGSPVSGGKFCTNCGAKL